MHEFRQQQEHGSRVIAAGQGRTPDAGMHPCHRVASLWDEVRANYHTQAQLYTNPGWKGL